MKGVWVVTDVYSDKVVAVIEHADVPKETVLKHYVAHLGLPEKAEQHFKIDFCPVIEWTNSLAKVFDPIPRSE